MKLKIKKGGEEILNLEVSNKEGGEITGNIFTKHLKKHKELYLGVALTGAGLTGLGISSKLLNAELKRAYIAGAERMHQLVWEDLAEKMKDGILNIELIGETDDETLKRNIEILKSAIESKED